MTCVVEVDNTSNCPNNYSCTSIRGSTEAVCCPMIQANNNDDIIDEISNEELARSQTSAYFSLQL